MRVRLNTFQTVSPVATHFSVVWSVCLVVCLSHSYTLLKLFDGFICHLAVHFTGSVTRARWGSLTHTGYLGVIPSLNMQLLPTGEKDSLWFTRWQHRSAVLPLTISLWFLLFCYFFDPLFSREPKNLRSNTKVGTIVSLCSQRSTSWHASKHIKALHQNRNPLK